MSPVVAEVCGGKTVLPAKVCPGGTETVAELCGPGKAAVHPHLPTAVLGHLSIREGRAQVRSEEQRDPAAGFTGVPIEESGRGPVRKGLCCQCGRTGRHGFCRQASVKTAGIRGGEEVERIGS